MKTLSLVFAMLILLTTGAPTRAQTGVTAAAPRRLVEVAVPSQTAITFERILHADQEPQNWLTYSGTLSGRRYSPLTQITTDNVKDLAEAWRWQSPSSGMYQATSLVADGILYTVHGNDVVALDGATGRVLWTYPYEPTRYSGRRANRGLAILGDTVYMGTLDAHLLAIGAYTGKLKWNVTVANAADPTCGEGRCYSITLAPLVVKDKVIVGPAGGEGLIRGFIAAFDAATGSEVWRFETIPPPGEPGNETWSGDSWKTGGAPVWNTGTYDPDLNLTYWGIGNPAPYDPNSRLGDNLYSNSVVALDADTGKLKWHYQFTPHDEADWDATQVPVLTDIDWQGRPRKVMLFANRNGLIYVLDRTTGQFLMGKPFVEVNWMSGFDEKGRPRRIPRTDDTPLMPAAGDLGATNWYPPSYSPNTGLFYVPSLGASSTPRYSAIRALDPRTGEKKWEFRLGGGTGAIFMGGVLTTASDLLFTGIQRGTFYALDARTGQLLWQKGLERIQSGPISYSIGGKQYVAVAAGNTLVSFALKQ